MGNFCTQCGRPLQEGEICNCTQQAAPEVAPQPAPQPIPQPVPQAAPQPAPQPIPQPTPQPVYQQVPPQPAVPSQTSIEIKNGFNNLLTALKKIWTNPTQAASALAQKDSWLPALILIAAQALFTGCYSLTNFGVGLSMDDGGFLLSAFFFTFLSSLAFSAAAMGMYLGIGKATKGDVSLKSALATASIRCFICLPLTLIGLLLGMASAELGMFFFLLGEIIAAFLTILAVQETYKVNTNRAFLIVTSTYIVLFILFVTAAALFNVISPVDVFGFNHSFSALKSSWGDLYDYFN